MSAREWTKLAPAWERGQELMWASTRPISEWLVERLAPSPGETILDLAAGTGQTGFVAARHLGADGKLISSDRSASMVDAARRLAVRLAVENVEFRVLDAERIELPDASVDGVLSRFGYVLRGDPPPALGEVRRVLRPRGRLAFAVWAERERNPWMTVPVDAMVALGRLAPPPADDVRLSQRRNPDAIRALLADSGLAVAEMEELDVSYRFADAEELWFFVSELRGPVALALAELDDDERREVRDEIERGARRSGEGFELAGVSLAVLAR